MYLQIVILLAFGLYFASSLSLGYLATYLLLKTVSYFSPWLPIWLWIGDIGLFIHAVAIAATSAVGAMAILANKAHPLKICTYVLMTLLLIEIGATVQLTTRKLSLGKAIHFDMKKAMQSSQLYYSTNISDTQMWDEIQFELNCCGVEDYTDWFHTSFGNGTDVPDSCCLLVSKGCGNNISHNSEPDDEIITEGCLPTIMKTMLDEYNYHGYRLWLPVVIIQIILILLIIMTERKLFLKKPGYLLYNISGKVQEDTSQLLFKTLHDDRC